MGIQPHQDVLRHTAAVVSAHLGNNKVDADMVPELIQSVYRALSGLGGEPELTAAKPAPAVPVRKSVLPDYIVCLEDGAKLKMLKRYLQKRFNMTPAAYRERWGLPVDYPMVAPSYAQKRSAMAKNLGLGRKKTVEEAVADEAVDGEQAEPGMAADEALRERAEPEPAMSSAKPGKARTPRRRASAGKDRA